MTVTASDGTATATRAVTVTVTNVNEPPVITGPAVVSKTSGSDGLALATYTATDPDAGDASATVTWGRTGPDAGLIHVVPDQNVNGQGELAFIATPVFGGASTDRDNLYDVNVVATVGGRATSLRVLVPLHRRDLPPTLAAGGATLSAQENSTGQLHDYAATDPDGHALTWELSGDDADDFNIHRHQGRLSFASAPDFEDPDDADTNNVYKVNVVVVDGPHRVERAVTVTVTNVDEAPVLSGQTSISFTENSTADVATYTVVDPENDAVTWSLGGADASSFNLVNGVLSFKNAPDHEIKPTYAVTVTATAGGKSDSLDVRISVSDVNEVHTISGSASVNVHELTTHVGDYTVSDPEGHVRFDWAVSGTDAASFSISGTDDGTLSFSTAPDFESKQSYSVTVEATDRETPPLTATLDVTVTVTNVDEGGTVTLSASTPLVGTAVTATLSDPDGNVSGETWQWSYAGVANSDISGATSASYTPVAADLARRLQVNVNYTDPQGSGKSAQAQTSGAVTQRTNSAPAFSADTATRSVAEDTASGTNLGAAFTATDSDTGDTLTYSLEGDDASSFSINSSSGQVSTSGALDHELDPSLSVTVKATDSAGATDTIDVTVSVTDVEETGTVTLSPSTPSVGTAFTATLTDPDGGVSGETWTWSKDGTAISGATTSSYTPEAGDVGSTLSVTVNYSDRRGSGKSASAEAENAVTEEANDPPTLTCTTTSVSLDEEGGTAVATYSATDPEGQTIAWSLKGPDQGDFSISNAGAVTFNSAPDFENPADADTDNEYSVTVAASDGTKESTCAVTVTVTNVDEAGSLAFSTTDVHVGAELTVTLSDPDRVTSSSWRWTRGTTTLSGATSTATSSRYTPVTADETERLTVAVTYTDGHGSGKTLTETTNAVGARTNRAPHFPATTATRSVAENTPAGQNIGDAFTATDPDGDTLTYTMSGDDAASFSFNASTRRIQTKAALDFETDPSLSVTITATDPGGLSHAVDVTISVTNVDEPPAITSDADHTYAENGEDAVATFTADDPEGEDPTWAISGTDAADFAIDATTGALSFASPPDFEAPADSNRDNEYRLTVQASDGSESSTLAVTVTVTNADESGAIGLSNDTPQVGIEFIATLTDPDGGITNEVWQWLVGTETVPGATSDRYTPEVDDIGQHLSVAVQYQDRTGSASVPLQRSVNAVIAAPDNPVPPKFPAEETGRREIAEDATATATADAPVPIGAPVRAVDANAGDTIAYTLDSASQARFAIDSANGQLSAKAPLDYETRRTHRVRVTATDPQETSVTITVTITVTDVDEAPDIEFRVGSEAVNFPENGTGTVVSVRANDPERETVELTLTGADASHFTLENGVLTFNADSLPDFESGKTTYTVTVVATEADDDDTETNELFANQNIAITIIDINEAPVPSGRTALSVEEVTTGGSPTGNLETYLAGDPEGFVVDWSLAGPDSAQFTISVEGHLEFLAEPDFETPRDANRDNVYELTLRAFDGSHTGSLTVTVTVTNVDESSEARVELSHVRAVAGVPIGATLYDPEATSPTVTWEWDGAVVSAGASRSAGDAPKASAPEATPPESRIGGSLQAYASYVDNRGQSKRISSTPGGSVHKVVYPPQPENTDPFFTEIEVSRSVAEGAEAGTAIGAPVTAGDDDAYRDPVTRLDVNDRNALLYTLGGASAALFDINRETGQLLTRAPLDFETEQTHTVTVTATDPELASATATVTITVTDVDEAPVIRGPRVVFHRSGDGDTAVTTFTVADPEEEAVAWSLEGADADRFAEMVGGELEFLADPDFDSPQDANRDNVYEVTVIATEVDDGDDDTEEHDVRHDLIVGVASSPVVRAPSPRTPGTPGPPVFIPGGGGGGGPSGPSPSELDFEWNVDRDIEALAGAHDMPAGMWADGATLWLLQNGSGADDAVYAYDLESGERVEEREFPLDDTNRAPRGLWADGETMWVSDSGRDLLFAYSLADGERLPARDIVLDNRNRDPRGIQGRGGVLWVLDGRTDGLFAYALDGGRLIAEYSLHSANSDPRGLWSDGVTVGVSDHGAKRLFAYRLPALPPGAPPEDPPALERVQAEDFEEPGRVGNNSPRGIWGDGDVIFVADQNDGRVYSYNIPDAIDARLASLTLGAVEIGEFSPGRTEYEGVADAEATVTTVTTEALQSRATVVIEPPDADDAATGHQIELAGLDAITATVTSADGSRTRAYVVRFDATPAPWSHCLAGAIAEGFSLVVYEGGSVDDLVACAGSRVVTALYALIEGDYEPYFIGAPDFVNRDFRALFPDGVPALTPLIVKSDGPPSADPVGARAGRQPWPECLRGAIAEGFSAVVYEGGSVEDLVECAASLDVAAVYALHVGEWASYFVGAPDFVNRDFGELFGDGVPAVTPFLVKRDEPAPAGPAGEDDAASQDADAGADAGDSPPTDAGDAPPADAEDAPPADSVEDGSDETPAQGFGSGQAAEAEQQAARVVGNTGGTGVAHRNDCADDARLPRFGWADGQAVQVVEEGSGRCAGWLRVRADDGVTSWVREEYLLPA